MGVIHDPFRNETFAAVAGQGATLNGSPMHVSAETDVGAATVATGTGPSLAAAQPTVRGIGALLALPVRTVRMLGSAAIMFAWVACGRLTAYVEVDLNSWDHAAGAVLVREAGGYISDLDDSLCVALPLVLGCRATVVVQTASPAGMTAMKAT